MKKLFLLVFIAAGLVSCNFSMKKKNSVGDKVSGEKVAGWYYYHVMNNNFDSIPNLMTDEYKSKVSVADLENQFRNREAELGQIVSFTLRDWETSKVKTRNNNETKFIFVYDIQYDKGEGEEKIYMERKNHRIRINEVEFERK